MEEKNLMFYDNTWKEIYTEKRIRRLSFEENLADLNNNKEDIFENIITIESVCKSLVNSLKADIKIVVKELNECWGYDIDILQKINE